MKRRNIIIGFLLMFIGIQLNVVRTYTLSPKATKFWMENVEAPTYVAQQTPLVQLPQAQSGYNSYANSPYSQASYGNNTGSYVQQAPVLRSAPYGPKRLTPPDWICWPFIFVGAVFVLYGSVLGRN